MNLPKKALIYIFLMLCLTGVVIYFIAVTYEIPSIKMLCFWSLLAIITESLLIPLPNNTVGVSVGFAISLASIIVGGPLMGTIVSFTGVLLRVPKIKGRGYIHLFNIPPYKTFFNVSQSIIITGVAGALYIATGGETGKFLLFPTLAIVLVDVVLNTIIISGFLSLANKKSFIRMWISNITGTLLNAIAVGSVGVIIALAYIGYGYGAVLLFFGPLLLARFSFKLYIDMRNVYISTIHALTKSMEAKDSYTSGHACRVQEYAVELAKAMKLPHKKVENIKTAAILHDIGKIGVDDGILRKTSRLTEMEYQSIMTHPVIGAQIIQDVDFLKDIGDIIKYHHERYDGKGYPDGLKKDEIPIEAAILAIADVFDAMTSDRPYRMALDRQVALEEIKINAGKQFHPQAADCFVNMMSA